MTIPGAYASDIAEPMWENVVYIVRQATQLQDDTETKEAEEAEDDTDDCKDGTKDEEVVVKGGVTPVKVSPSPAPAVTQELGPSAPRYQELRSMLEKNKELQSTKKKTEQAESGKELDEMRCF